MPNRIANVALTVHRDGKRTNVKAGEKFNFTKEEIADFTKLNPVSLRLPINEGSADENEVPQNTSLTGNGQNGGTGDNEVPQNTSLTGNGQNGGTGGNGGAGGTVDLDSMKVDDLRKYAKDNELDVDTTQNKEPLLAAIKAAVADKEDL